MTVMNIGREIRGAMYQLYKLFNKHMPQQGEAITLDVVIPVLEKDLKVLPLCLEGVRRCVGHRIGEIYLVSPESEKVRTFCRENDLHFVEESSVLGYGPKEVGFITESGKNRSGWLFQQLIKLSGALGTNRHYLVIDADHVLLARHLFLAKGGCSVFYRSTEHHTPYYENIRRLTGLCSGGFFSYSYVTHKMVFDKERLRELRRLIEERNGMAWDQAIIASLDRREMSPFSEFELYGYYVPKGDKLSRPWCTKSMSYEHLDSYEALKARYGKKYWAVTFPDYYNTK